MKLPSLKLKGFQFSLRGRLYHWTVYIAPFDDKIKLGLDFLLYHHAVLDLDKCVVSLNDQSIRAWMCRNEQGQNMR